MESFMYTYNWTVKDFRRPAGRPTCRVSGIYGALNKEGADWSFRGGRISRCSIQTTVVGWETPSYFPVAEENEMSTLAREYHKVKNACGVIDMAYRGKIEVRGADSQALLDYVCASKPAEVSV